MATAAELNLFNQLMATGDYAGAAQVAQQAGYNSSDVAAYINQNLAGLNLPTDANISADVVQSLYTPTPTPITPTSVNVPTGPVPGSGYTAPTVDPLTAASGESMIDPVIAPYLSEALGRARSLFLTGAQPELYPGQMYVSPSAQTETALTQMEQLAGLAQPFYEEAAGGVTAGLEGLRRTAGGEFLGGATFKNAAGEDVNYRDALISAATRPLTQQFTEEVMPGIQSTFSRAGRLGSGAQGAVTGRATEGFTRALGDVTSRIAAEDYARERGFQEAATRDVLLGAGRLGDITSSFLAPSSVLADVGARREAIAGQPLAESIRRFEYTQNLPQDQFAKYMASIYGSPLGTNTAAPTTSGNPFLTDLGAALNVAGSIPNAVTGLQTGYAGLKSAGTAAANFLGGLIK
jgi:hypothetical protein